MSVLTIHVCDWCSVETRSPEPDNGWLQLYGKSGAGDELLCPDCSKARTTALEEAKQARRAASLPVFAEGVMSFREDLVRVRKYVEALQATIK